MENTITTTTRHWTLTVREPEPRLFASSPIRKAAVVSVELFDSIEAARQRRNQLVLENPFRLYAILPV